MKIKQETFLDILGIPNTQFVVPVYQRVYSWTTRQCETLWEDVMRAATTGRSHFTGVLLYSLDANSWGDCGRLRIIDGQQRLTTATLMLIALRDEMRELGKTVGSDEATWGPDDIMKHYLLAGEGEEAPCKLMLSHLDRGTLATLVDGGKMPKEHSARLEENLEIFKGHLREARNASDGGEGGDAVDLLWRGLNQMQVITALLEEDDSPQLVFESLNSKGMPLTAGDLIRNALLFGTNEDQRHQIYLERWHPLEQKIAQIEGLTMDKAIRAWLAARFREERVRTETDIYGVLRDHLRESGETIDEMLDDFSRFGDKYVRDSAWRSQVDKYAADWLQDKPRASVSQFKMFGN